MPQTQVIEYFTGEFAFLSNFYSSTIRFDNILYPTVEHAFQAQKTHDDTLRRQIAQASSPGNAKRLGRAVNLRKDWESVKVALMTDIVRVKFQCHHDLATALLETGAAKLIEGNNWNDRFWGTCGGVGKNWLGRILMQVRDELRTAADRADS